MSQRDTTSDVFLGIGILFLAHLGFWALLTVLSFIANVLAFFPLQAVVGFAGIGIGISQLLYAIPLGIRLKRRRRFKVVKGIIIGAVITALLNGGCFIFMLWFFSNMYG